MDGIRQRIKELIQITLAKCESWLGKEDDGLLYFIDPIDKCEISAHYGATHAAAAFIIWGKIADDNVIYEKGTALLDSILNRWDKNKGLSGFHLDFNSFALTMLADLVDENIANRIKEAVLSTPDSNHDTVNWLPMRWAVNQKRLGWTSDSKYRKVIERCKLLINNATNTDGGIEDCLPKGTSFNLQYDVATVAVLQYLNTMGSDVDLSRELGFLLNCVAPDGDINYIGRGTNQVFVWGLWIYLLSSSGQSDSLYKAVEYLADRLPSMLANNNLMLNDWNGEEKYLWWDYHYASVYTAHCLLWLVLAYRDMGMYPINPVMPESPETGVHIYRSENYFVSWFEGRQKYLAEKGPVIEAIWSKRKGMICKGTFGPWQGAFGNKYIFEDVVLMNFFGLMEVRRNRDLTKNRYIHKLFPWLDTATSIRLLPKFVEFDVHENTGVLEITFKNECNKESWLQIPLIGDSGIITTLVDDIPTPIMKVVRIRNQYGWINVFQTHLFKGEITLRIN